MRIFGSVWLRVVSVINVVLVPSMSHPRLLLLQDDHDSFRTYKAPV